MKRFRVTHWFLLSTIVALLVTIDWPRSLLQHGLLAIPAVLFTGLCAWRLRAPCWFVAISCATGMAATHFSGHYRTGAWFPGMSWRYMAELDVNVWVGGLLSFGVALVMFFVFVFVWKSWRGGPS